MTTERSELLRLLADLSDAAPQLRMGQMLTNLATLARGADAGAVWECEDEELTAAAQRLLTRLTERRAAVA